jgi:putative restriction endonuclease
MTDTQDGGTREVTAAGAVSNRWRREQLKLAFHLYCQLPFGKLHHSNPEIVTLAALIGRTPSAVAMKLSNFASLDPAITGSGRKGLEGASKLDREVWDEFHADWEGLALECGRLRQDLDPSTYDASVDDATQAGDYAGETRRVFAEQRIKQRFFRRAVLSSYRGRCCMSGVSDARLLIASHIVPWSADKSNRLNPSNGLCLSALHDRAFDSRLIWLTDDFRVVLSPEIECNSDAFLQSVFRPLAGTKIEMPDRFAPSVEFIAKHRAACLEREGTR